MPDLLHVIPISKKKRNRHNTELIEESVVPDLLHVIPIVDHAVLDRVPAAARCSAPHEMHVRRQPAVQRRGVVRT
jgi:hypothetical protein